MNSPKNIPPIPANTSHAAKSVYSQDNFFLIVGDRLDIYLANLPQNGRELTGLSIYRDRPPLALVTIFQCIEKLSDSQAVEATRTRVDWKYALHLSLIYPGMLASSLCEYRLWLFSQPPYQQKFQLLLNNLIADGLLSCDPGQCIETAQVLEEVCSVTRLDNISRAFQLALETLATYQPKWLRSISLPHWYAQYQVASSRPGTLLNKEERGALTEALGADAFYLLERFTLESQPGWTQLEEIQALREVWHRQFEHLPTCSTKLRARCANC